MIKVASLAVLLATSVSSGCGSAANDSESEQLEDVHNTSEVATDEELPEGTIVLISTDYGDIKVLLYDDTPQHRDNFVKLINEGFYDGLLFHRVMKDFMIQGGDPDSKGAATGTLLGNGGPGYTVPAEFNPKYYHKKGSLAAARQPDQVNPLKASSGSQFYLVQGQVYDTLMLSNMAMQLEQQMMQTAISAKAQSDADLLQEIQEMQMANDQESLGAMIADLTSCVKGDMLGLGNGNLLPSDLESLSAEEVAEIEAYSAFSFSEEQIEAYTTIGGTPFLDMNYTVFGEVIDGLEVIDQIAAVETDANDRPNMDVSMTIKVLD